MVRSHCNECGLYFHFYRYWTLLKTQHQILILHITYLKKSFLCLRAAVSLYECTNPSTLLKNPVFNPSCLSSLFFADFLVLFFILLPAVSHSPISAVFCFFRIITDDNYKRIRVCVCPYLLHLVADSDLQQGGEVGQPGAVAVAKNGQLCQEDMERPSLCGKCQQLAVICPAQLIQTCRRRHSGIHSDWRM